ncbi:flagellar protein FliS [Escherichia coli]|uniref:Flagellar protein FliS n=1 Tax=Escherichia coli TaxID=562 RepID=A0A484X4I7_ECOLX|nr:flagellar protein FliS [Escherichia coli]
MSLCQKRSTSLRTDCGWSLDEESKDELTQNLIALYSYMVRRLLQANLRNDVSAVEEVEALMRNIADAWKESYSPLL